MTRNGRSGAELESLEKVRELLLATDRKNTDDRLGGLERELRGELRTLQKTWSRELRELGDALRQEFGAIAADLEREGAARLESEEVQARRLEAVKTSLRARCERVDAESKQRTKGLRERITASSRKLREEVRACEDKSLERLQAELETLRAQGVSREQLAGLLGRLAEQIGAEEA